MHLATAGHSLGGAYANCCFLQLLAMKHSLATALLLGGSYTFGAPLVAFEQEGLPAAEAVQALFLQQCQSDNRYRQLDTLCSCDTRLAF